MATRFEDADSAGTNEEADHDEDDLKQHLPPGSP
jgi:hypothetical protein